MLDPMGFDGGRRLESTGTRIDLSHGKEHT
jgi:hypothetical protein